VRKDNDGKIIAKKKKVKNLNCDTKTSFSFLNLLHAENEPNRDSFAQEKPKRIPEKFNNKPIISSLFHKNPEIPIMETQDVTQVDEKLFSSSQFSDLAIHDYLKSTLEKDMGLEVMTEIQSKAIPELLEKHNACIQSQTGSGKTLVYAIPIIQVTQKVIFCSVL